MQSENVCKDIFMKEAWNLSFEEQKHLIFLITF